MPASKAQQRAVAKYMAANYDEVKIRIPKGRKADLEEKAQKMGVSVNGLINSVIRDLLEMTEDEWRKTAEE